MTETGLPVTPPDHWRIASMPDAVEIWDKKRVPVNKAERDKRIGEIPYFGATGQVGWIDDYLFDDELILLGEDGAPFLEPNKQKAYVIRGKSWVNNHAHVLKARDGVESAFIKHYLDILDYGQFVSGTTRLKLTQASMRRIPIPLPCPDEQKKIVDEIETQFARLDNAVTVLQRARIRLKRYRASALKAACEGRLVPIEAELARQEGRDYEPASVLLNRIKAERDANDNGQKRKGRKTPTLDTANLPELPEGWTWTNLSSIADIKGGITKGQKRKLGETVRDVPYLRVANVQRGFLDLSEVKTIEAPEDKIRELLLDPGDVLFNEGGDRDKLGRGWVWQGEIPDCIHQNHVFRARMLDCEIEPKFISWYGNTFGQQYFLEQGKQTTNLASINMTKLSALPIPIPPAAEQKRVTAEVERSLSMVDLLETTVGKNLKRTEALRKSVLRMAFSGRLVMVDRC